jgi:hypothetical protein
MAADDTRRTDPPAAADDFVHVLLGIASLGEKIEVLGESIADQPNPMTETPAPVPSRWLR